MKIQVLISTMNDGILNINYRKDFNYLIIHQVNNGKSYSFITEKLPSNIKYYQSNDVGLSKSRNLALLKAKAEYVWIMDDDVTISDDALYNLENIINSKLNFDMLVLSHSSHKNNSPQQFKVKKITRLSAMSVSSIDMFIKRDSIIAKKIKFNEKFGLGTSHPSGEEFIFTTQLLKEKLVVLKSNLVFSYHPPIASGNDFFSTDYKLITKLLIFKLCYGNFLGYLIYLIFIIKKSRVLIKNKRLINAIKVMIFQIRGKDD